MNPETNPYNPGAGYPPPELVGRDPLISQVRIALGRRIGGRHGKHFFLIGLRGVGKTVLLKHVRSIAREMGYEEAFGEAASLGPSSGAFPRRIAKKIADMLPHLTKGLAAKASEKIRRSLSAFSVGISPDGVSLRIDADPSFSNTDYALMEEDLTDLVIAVGEAAAARKKGILIAVDEVQDLSEGELAALIAAAHQADQQELPVLLIGAGLPHLPGKAGNAKSYSERLFNFRRLGPLPEDDARAALLLPAEREGVKIQQAALDLMVSASEGYPYFIQEWGNNTWDVAKGRTITADDVKTAEPLVESSLDENFYQVRMGRLTPKEAEYLQAMARLGPGPHRSADIAEQLGVRSEKISARRKDLIDKGMIYSPAHGEIAFSVPLFHKYLNRIL